MILTILKRNSAIADVRAMSDKILLIVAQLYKNRIWKGLQYYTEDYYWQFEHVHCWRRLANGIIIRRKCAISIICRVIGK